jgi:hypothetical protein
LFDAAIENNAKALLNGDTPYNRIENSSALNELCKVDPELAAGIVQLYTRAMSAKTHQLLTERKINIPRMLAERVRLVRAQTKVNAFTKEGI